MKGIGASRIFSVVAAAMAAAAAIHNDIRSSVRVENLGRIISRKAKSKGRIRSNKYRPHQGKRECARRAESFDLIDIFPSHNHAWRDDITRQPGRSFNRAPKREADRLERKRLKKMGQSYYRMRARRAEKRGEKVSMRLMQGTAA